MIVDLVIDLVSGDSGKGKVVHHLLKSGGYTHTVKTSGGSNCGHTVYHNGEKIVLHLIPTGVLYGIDSIICAGCVVNVEKFYEELNYLTIKGFDVSKVKIAYNAHIVTDAHIAEDKKDTKIGSTGQGIMPAYRDKYARTGIRAEQVPELKDYICDPYEEFRKQDSVILVEGAQGFLLCPDFGDYPFVTSSPPSVAYAMHSMGAPVQSVRKVYGLIKSYTTYSGFKQFHGNGPIFDKLQELGQEFGATTGRRRQINWLDLNMLERAIGMNGVTDLIVNKMDISRQVSAWTVLKDKKEKHFNSETDFKECIDKLARQLHVENVTFSYSPKEI